MARPAGAESSDGGYFPRGRSILRRVMRERAVNLLYGQRALMIGALHPLAFIGTTRRSKSYDRPWQRLAHTAEMFDAVFFGSRAEADRVLAMTRRLHDRVSGTIGVQAGPWGPESRFSAYDPELMAWVTAPVFDSALVLYETFVRRLSPTEREGLYQETVSWGALFGMPREAMPADYDGFRCWWPEQITGSSVHLTEEARLVGLNIALRIPSPPALTPVMRLFGFMTVGTLPVSVREQYGLGWGARERAAFDALALGLRRSRPFVPASFRRGSSADAYRLVARTERVRLRAGKPPFVPVGGASG